MDWNFLQNIKLVFATGSPKSGTTFLQMILNAHPEVSCPAEHYLFDLFIEKLPNFLENYNKGVVFIDKATANQGAPVFTDEDREEIGKFIIKLAAYNGAKGRKVKWYGIKDDQLTERNGFEVLERLFPDAKFIGIIRDPRAVCVSAWYFNMRIHSNWLENIENKEKWAEIFAPIWVRDTTYLLNFFKKNPSKMFLVRYEDLRLKPFENYKKFLSFWKLIQNQDL